MKAQRMIVRSIDAWRDDGLWTWNDSMIIGEMDISPDITNRQLLRLMREDGYLSDYSKGKVRIEQWGDSCYEIQDRRTFEPLYSIEPDPYQAYENQ